LVKAIVSNEASILAAAAEPVSERNVLLFKFLSV
jgi:hypothetical protein